MSAETAETSASRRPITITTAYDPSLRRYRAICSECGRETIRATKRSATHVAIQHVAYDHGREAREA